MYKNSVDCAVCLGAFGVYYDAFSWIKFKDSQHKLIPPVIFFFFFSESASVDFDCPSFGKILAHFFVYFVCVCVWVFFFKFGSHASSVLPLSVSLSFFSLSAIESALETWSISTERRLSRSEKSQVNKCNRA